MDKDEFLSKLESELKYLTDEAKEEEISKMSNAKNYAKLDVYEEANKIYKARGLKMTVGPKNSVINSIGIIIEYIKKKDSKTNTNLLLFAVYAFILIILLKIPFLFIRDTMTSLLGIVITNQTIKVVWYLALELLYAATAIITALYLIKYKANDLTKGDKKDA